MQTENMGHLLSGASTEITAVVHSGYCDVLALLAASSSGTEVRRTGEVSVSYYSLVNAPTFPFWGNTVIAAQPGLLGSSHTTADASA